MAFRYLETHVALPPGSLSSEQVRHFLQLVLQGFHWFVPERFGTSSLRERLSSSSDIEGALIRFYEAQGYLCVAARTDKDYLWIHPAPPEAPPCSGRLVWATSLTNARSDAWRKSHVHQVSEVMELVHAPLAVASTSEDTEHKTKRLIPDGDAERLAFTVRDYSEGLAGLFWRNFFGPPFLRLFCQRLDSLPPECVQRLGEELVLVQPYEKPSEAGSPDAVAQEQHLISLLGSDCFYDHTHHTPPSQRPQLALP